MAKEYTVFLDGQDRLLHYTIDEREAIEDAFPNEGTPGSLAAIVNGHLIRNGSVKVQAFVMWQGLKHISGKWTLERVRNLLAAASANGGDSRPLIVSTYKAIFASGILGHEIDLDPEPKADEGKAEPTA